MGTIKKLNDEAEELSDEVGQVILAYIVKHRLKPSAIEALLRYVYKSSEEFIRDYLKNVL